MEIWKDVPQYEKCYQVSNKGRIRSIDRFVKSNLRHTEGKQIKKRGKLLRPDKDKNGYPKVSLCKNGIKAHRFVHRLVALAFIPNQENKPTVNHIDGVKDNNLLENLEWATYSENMQHAHDMGLSVYKSEWVRGEAGGMSKLNDKIVREIRKSKQSARQLCAYYGVGIDTIYRVIRGKSWKHVK